MTRYLLFGLVAVLLLISQMLLRVGVRGEPIRLADLGDFGALILQILTSPVLLAGYAISAVAAVLWLLVLSRFELSLAVPMLSALYYVLLLLASAAFLGEGVGAKRWLGVVLIVIGIFVLSRE